MRRAKATLSYHLSSRPDAGADMLPLLVYAMAQTVKTPIVRPPGVVQLYNDIETERDYDVGLPNVQNQKAHAVSSKSGVELDGVPWDCKSTDGYMCSCKPRKKTKLLKLGRGQRGGRGGRGRGGRGRGARGGRGADREDAQTSW